MDFEELRGLMIRLLGDNTSFTKMIEGSIKVVERAAKRLQKEAAKLVRQAEKTVRAAAKNATTQSKVHANVAKDVETAAERVKKSSREMKKVVGNALVPIANAFELVSQEANRFAVSISNAGSALVRTVQISRVFVEILISILFGYKQIEHAASTAMTRAGSAMVRTVQISRVFLEILFKILTGLKQIGFAGVASIAGLLGTSFAIATRAARGFVLVLQEALLLINRMQNIQLRISGSTPKLLDFVVTAQTVSMWTRLGNAIGRTLGMAAAFEHQLRIISTGLRSFGMRGLFFVTIPVIASFVAATKAASDFQEEISRFRQVFKGLGDDAEAAAQMLEDAFFIPKEQAIGLLGNTGAIAKNLGFTTKQALALSTQTQKMAAAMAAFNNLQVDDVSERLSKAWVGLVRNLRIMQVAVRQNSPEFEELKKQIIESTGATNEQAMALAVMKMTINQSTIQVGHAAREQFNLATQARILAGEVRAMAIAFGDLLLPAMTDVVIFTRIVVRSLTDLTQIHKTAAMVLAAFAAVVPVLSLVLSALIGTLVVAAIIFIAFSTGVMASTLPLLGVSVAVASVVSSLGVLIASLIFLPKLTVRVIRAVTRMFFAVSRRLVVLSTFFKQTLGEELSSIFRDEFSDEIDIFTQRVGDASNAWKLWMDQFLASFRGPGSLGGIKIRVDVPLGELKAQIGPVQAALHKITTEADAVSASLENLRSIQGNKEDIFRVVGEDARFTKEQLNRLALEINDMEIELKRLETVELEAAEALKKLQDAAAKAIEKLQDRVRDLNLDLIVQRDTLGMSANAARIYRLQLEAMGHANLNVARNIAAQIEMKQAQLDLAESIEKTTDKLREQLIELQLGQDAALRHRLIAEGANKTQLDAIMNLQRDIELQKERNKLWKESRKLLEDLRKPHEIIGDLILQLRDMLAEGFITRAQGVGILDKEIDKLVNRGSQRAPETRAILANTAEGFTALRQGFRQDREEQALQQRKEAIRLLGEIDAQIKVQNRKQAPNIVNSPAAP